MGQVGNLQPIGNRPNAGVLRRSQFKPVKTMSETLIFVARHVGLANRLRALVGYDAMARVLNRRFLLCWLPDVACNAEFSDLFDGAAFNLVPPEEVAEMRTRSDVLVCAEPCWFHEVWRRHVQHVPWPEFLQAVSESLEQLRATPQISTEVASFAAAHRIHDAVGVHVRHTDNVALHEIRAEMDSGFSLASVSTPDGFRNAVRQCSQTGPVFVATDNPAIERDFRQEFGGSLLTYPKQYSSEWHTPADAAATLREPRTAPVRDALVEMLLLRSCRRIVGTYYSSFAEFAAVWGRVDYCDVVGSGTGRNTLVDSTIADLGHVRMAAR